MRNRYLDYKWTITFEKCERISHLWKGWHNFAKLQQCFKKPFCGLPDISFSLLNVFDSKRLADYWFKSGTPTYLVHLLARTRENLDELTGRYYFEREFEDYKATAEKPLPMIYQSGYLTIKDYNWEEKTFLLDFPNNEVKTGFLTAVASNYLKPAEDTGTLALQLSKALKNGDLETFRKLLTSFLASIPYSMRRKNDEVERERYFHYTFYLILRLMSIYTVYTEKNKAKGG